MARIVVGIDGSKGSKKALDWAAEEAKLHGATLELVHVYEAPFTHEPVGRVEDVERVMAGAHEMAKRTLESFRSEVDAGVRVKTFPLLDSSASHALVEHSKGADMLVVSARGLGPFRRLVLGSVSTQLAHHAEVPLVIVRSETKKKKKD